MMNSRERRPSLWSNATRAMPLKPIGSILSTPWGYCPILSSFGYKTRTFWPIWKRKVTTHGCDPGLALDRNIAAHHLTEPPADHEAKGADDLLDALACAAVARRIHAGTARPFPDPPERDAFGLPMAIWA
jgi:Protein of unknown function (DUF429)